MQHLVEHNAKGPDIGFLGVLVIEYGLRSHVQRGTDIEIFQDRLSNSKARVPNLAAGSGTQQNQNRPAWAHRGTSGCWQV
jgi:hypothetical protein